MSLYTKLECVILYCIGKKLNTMLEAIASLGTKRYQPCTILECIGFALNIISNVTMK